MSPLFRLNWQDLLKGVIVAVLASFLTSLYAIISTGAFPTGVEWKTILFTALAAGLAYLTKNFFTKGELPK